MRTFDIGVVGGPHIISVTEHDDGTHTYDIPGMFVHPDLDEWVFDEVEDNTTAGGPSVESTKLGCDGSTPSCGTK